MTRATAERVADEPLRLRALEVLGPLGDVLASEGSHGSMHAHRVVVLLPEELTAQLASNHAAKDALAAVLAAAMAERAGHSVADVRFEFGELAGPALGPYRDPRS